MARPSAMAYAYEDVKYLVERTSHVAGAYAYERLAYIPQRTSHAAGAYAYEQAIPADPNQLYVWDATLEEYVRVPWYVFNGETGQWQQVL